MGFASGGVIGPVGIFIFYLKSNDGSTIRALQGNQYLEELVEESSDGFGVGRVVGTQCHVRIT